MLRRIFYVFLLFFSVGSFADAQNRNNLLSQSFELRYVTNDKMADGETDFKGSTEWMNTDMRVEYLTKWADFACRLFDDDSLDQMVVSDTEVKDVLNKIKPQPLPQVRKEILLDEWKFSPSFSRHIPLSNTYHFEKQTWRFRLELEVDGTGSVALMDGERVVCEYRNDGTLRHLIFEVDLTRENRRYNLKANGKTIVDFQPLNTRDGGVDRLELKGCTADRIWGLGYMKNSDTRRLNQPMFAKTFLDANSRITPDTDGWNRPDYDDSSWDECKLPKNHGTERHEGEALLLRKWVRVDSFEKAYFELESLFPSGELWVNGKVVEVMKNGHRQWIDITKYLKNNTENLIAIRIDPFHADFKQLMHHCPTDPNIGWFSGRAKLHLTHATHLNSLYVYLKNLKGDVAVEATIQNTSYNFYKGVMKVLLTDWFPEEGKEWEADSMFVILEPQETKIFRLDFNVRNIKLWSYQKPQLYKVRALLVNSQSGMKTETFSAVDGDLARTREMYVDKLTDDMVVTTGFRTIEQDGGTFRINGQPELLRAPLYFGQRFPLESNALELLSPRIEDIVREMLAVKKMNGNGMRMSAHWSDDSPQDGTNDPRFTEIADQLGLMFIWQTSSWIRLRSPLVADFQGMAEDVRQLRNSPSIVIWQPSNHPSLTDWTTAMAYWHKVYDAIYPNDTTRLITPTADFRHTRVYNDDGTRDNKGRPVKWCDPVWTANRISRGSMDYPTGFGQDWEYLRRWPFPHKWPGNADINSFLTSKDRAYFNFEQEETIGQMNWSLFKGTPVYKFHSYEWDYDEGSIGRLLSCDEWRESQAWQAFSAYESIRKMRWLDYDGLSWCCMWGGGNMGTYQKPLIDALGHKKLAFYAHCMGFQQMLAGSKNVDVVYGPDDQPQIIAMNLGKEAVVDIVLTVTNDKGKKVYKRVYKDIVLPAGRTVTDVARVSLPKLSDGFYYFNYQIIRD